VIPLSIVTEDRLSDAVIRRVTREISSDFTITASFPDLGRRFSSPGSSYIEQNIAGFNQAARHRPFLVLLDLDRRECAPSYRYQLLPDGGARYMILRIAVTEVESWILADRRGFSHHFSVSIDRVPREPDVLSDAKNELFKIVRNSGSRRLREAVLPESPTAGHGPDYNGALIRFLYQDWNLSRARAASNSLARACRALEIFRYP
jgi:hypothetical protein